jgi:hypothetical protein
MLFSGAQHEAKTVVRGLDRSKGAVDRNGYRVSEQIEVSRVKPRRGAEGALDTSICSELCAAVAIGGVKPFSSKDAE